MSGSCDIASYQYVHCKVETVTEKIEKSAILWVPIPLILEDLQGCRYNSLHAVTGRAGPTLSMKFCRFKLVSAFCQEMGTKLVPRKELEAMEQSYS